MNTFLLILVLILYLKWSIFAFMLPVIRFAKNRGQNKQAKSHNSEVIEQDNLSVNKKMGFFAVMRRYIEGYIRYADFQTGLIPSHRIRNFLYRHIWLVNMAPKSVIYWGAEIRASEKLRIGEGSIIGDKSLLDARNGIEIGKNVNISSNVHIYTEQHDHRDSDFRCNSDSTFRVRVEDRAWIGPNSLILHSVTIGEGAVIAAGAVVTKDVEPYTLVGGVPAKKIGERNRNLKYVFSGKPVPFY